jgi:hypothetical protein
MAAGAAVEPGDRADHQHGEERPAEQHRLAVAGADEALPRHQQEPTTPSAISTAITAAIADRYGVSA